VNDEIAIKVDNVSKDFSYTARGASSLKGIFTSLFQSKEGKARGKQHALRNVSLEIKKGEFFGIVGRNGSGKSTLLKMLAGIYQPNSGTIKTHGKIVPFIELGVGFNPELTGRENVYLNGAMLGFSKKQIDTFYSEVVEFAELEKFMEKKLKNYSSGMQVRLAFSMAIRAKADILLIDEVLAVGDTDFQRKCFEYFKSLKAQKKTVVFVSHDMNAIREFCDRAALIENRKIVAIGDTKEVSTKYIDLFIPHSSKKSHVKDDGINREGEGRIRIIEAELTDSVLKNKDQLLECFIRVKAFKDHENPMVGIRVKNSNGQILHEVNTWNEEITIRSIPIGETQQMVWRFPNIYAEGKYIVDLYAYTNNNRSSDIFNDALRFDVALQRRTGTLVDPSFEFKVQSEKDK